MKGKKDEQGVVLILSLLLLAVVTAVGIGVSLLVINEVRSTIRIDESVVATYAAEAKIEEALAALSTYRQIPGATLEAALDGAGPPLNISGVKTLGGIVPVGSANAIVDLTHSSSGEAFTLTTLGENQSVQFNVQTPACFTDYNDETCVKYIKFSGERLDSSGVEPWIEVTESAFSVVRTQETSVVKELVSESQFDDPANPYFYSFKGLSPLTLPAEVQSVRLTSLFNGVKNLEIRAFTDDTATCTGICPSDLLGYIVIKADSSFSKSKISITAAVPWQLPSSGLFDYALFSEETVRQD
ncbi:MAG: hypothetical protein WCV86_04310 [Patescibacteria group bacterium]|jgi:Tfp pilus assembly protein PilX